MSSWQSNKRCLQERASFAFRHGYLTDVRFIVGEEEFHAHKLLLSFASPVFEEHFGRHEHQDVMTISDVVPLAFDKMLLYIYTDTVQLENLNEAHDVLAAARKYMVDPLVKLCEEYIRERTIPPENACKMYEVAKKLNMEHILKYCMYTFVNQTEEVLRSDNFLEAHISTVEAIIQNDELSSDEKNIIGRVVKWGIAECQRKNIEPNGANIRSCINPLMKHLRFLSLTVEEFGNFHLNCDIFTKNEIFLITLMLSKENSVSSLFSLPPMFSQSYSRRGCNGSFCEVIEASSHLREEILPTPRAPIIEVPNSLPANMDIFEFLASLPSLNRPNKRRRHHR